MALSACSSFSPIKGSQAVAWYGLTWIIALLHYILIFKYLFYVHFVYVDFFHCMHVCVRVSDLGIRQL